MEKGAVKNLWDMDVVVVFLEWSRVQREGGWIIC